MRKRRAALGNCKANVHIPVKYFSICEPMLRSVLVTIPVSFSSPLFLSQCKVLFTRSLINSWLLLVIERSALQTLERSDHFFVFSCMLSGGQGWGPKRVHGDCYY